MNELDFLGNQSWKMQCCIILFLVSQQNRRVTRDKVDREHEKREHPEIEMQLMSGKLTWFQELSSKGQELIIH